MTPIRGFLTRHRQKVQDREREVVVATAELALRAFQQLDELLTTDKLESGTLAMENLLDSLKRNASNVVLYGNYSTGKSTLINSLTNHDVVLPHSPSPTTAVQTRVIAGSTYEARIYFAKRRIIGRLDNRRDFEVAPTLQAVWHMVSAPDTAVVAVHKRSVPTGPWTITDAAEIGRWRDHRTSCGSDTGTQRDIPSYLKLEFAPREAVTIDLSSPEGADQLNRWIKDDALALSLERIDVISASPTLHQVLYVDTPGIDSLVEEHHDITMRTLHAAHAILFLYSIRDDPQVHPDDRMALAELSRCVRDRPERLFIIGTFADLSKYEEEPNYRAEKAVQIMQKDAVMGLQKTLADYGALFPERRIDPKHVFPVNCTDLSHPLLDGERLRTQLEQFLTDMQGGPLLRSTAKLMARRVENRIAVLDRLIDESGPCDTEREQRMLSHRIARMEGLAQKPETELFSRIQKEMDETIDRRMRAVGEWVTNGFRDKKDVTDLKSKWEEAKAHFVKTFEAQAQATLQQIEETVNDVLEPRSNRFHLPEFDVSSVHFGFGKVEESLSGFWYKVKSFFDFLLPTNLRKSNIDGARAKAHEELGRAEPMLKKACTDALVTIHKEVKACLEEIRVTMGAFKNKLDALRGDAARRQEFMTAVSTQCEALRDAVQVLAKIARKRASMPLAGGDSR